MLAMAEVRRAVSGVVKWAMMGWWMLYLNP